MDRRVRSVKRDRSGNIVAVCNSEAKWSPRRKIDVIRDILENKKSYYVQEREKRRVPVLHAQYDVERPARHLGAVDLVDPQALRHQPGKPQHRSEEHAQCRGRRHAVARGATGVGGDRAHTPALATGSVGSPTGASPPRA